MTPFFRLLSILLILLLPSSGKTNSYAPILDNIKPGIITFIGETHQRPESTQLIQGLIKATLVRHQCLTLALEIDDRQQTVIDDVMRGRAHASEIRIPAAIDHPAMHDLIDGLAKLDMQQGCVDIKAIDTGVDTEADRDEWMAKHLAELPTDKPVLVLLGSLHTLKRVHWTIASGKPSVAEILANHGFRVKTYPQRWLPGICLNRQKRTSRFVSADKPEALAILNETIISLINAEPHKSATGVIDGLVIWGGC